MISAGRALEQADMSGQVSTAMEGRAGVLEAEIKLDGARGASTELKKQELIDVQKAAYHAKSAQMEQLGDANQEMRKMAEGERSKGRVNKEQANPSGFEDEDEQAEEIMAASEKTDAYSSVDIRL